jgi:hypothetical protein
MNTGTIQQTASVGGLSIQSNVTRLAEGQIGQSVALPVAVAGTLSTRGGDTAGTLTLGAGHGIVDADVINIFWVDVDGVYHCAYGATVGTVAGNDVPFTGASGDVLPTEDDAVTASVVVEIDTDFDGDLAEIIAAGSTKLAHIAFRSVTPTVLKAVLLLAAEGWSWISGQGITNPLTGDPVNDVLASNGDTTAEATLQIGVLYAST